MDDGFKLSTMICIEDTCQSNFLINKEREKAFCAKCNKEMGLQEVLDKLNENSDEEEQKEVKNIEEIIQDKEETKVDRVKEEKADNNQNDIELNEEDIMKELGYQMDVEEETGQNL